MTEIEIAGNTVTIDNKEVTTSNKMLKGLIEGFIELMHISPSMPNPDVEIAESFVKQHGGKVTKRGSVEHKAGLIY